MPDVPGERFKLEVKLMDDPRLWRWDITDAVRGAARSSFRLFHPRRSCFPDGHHRYKCRLTELPTPDMIQSDFC